jgi:hypothetical protein
MKLSICTMILALAAMASFAHASEIGPTVGCNSIQLNDKDGRNIGVISPIIIRNDDGTYTVDGEDAGKNLSDKSNVLDLDTYGGVLPTQAECHGAKVHIDLGTGEGTVETKHYQAGVFFESGCNASGEHSFIGCKVE